jgi:hypothetical protein
MFSEPNRGFFGIPNRPTFVKNRSEQSEIKKSIPYTPTSKIIPHSPGQRTAEGAQTVISLSTGACACSCASVLRMPHDENMWQMHNDKHLTSEAVFSHKQQSFYYLSTINTSNEVPSAKRCMAAGIYNAV